eukprot:Opistho-2@91317
MHTHTHACAYNDAKQTHTSQLCLVGMAVSFLGVLGATVLPVFAVLWGLYLSVFSVGETFLSFQWDILLLEAGFLTLVMAPLVRATRVNAYRAGVGMFLARWLLFRLMFQSGILKLTGGDRSWWGLTAMDWHYESQCLPTPLAWIAAQLPAHVHRFETVMTFAIEGVLPWLFLVPAWKGTEAARLLSGAAQAGLMVVVMATGNFTFFNLLTCVLCISCVDERTARRICKRGVWGILPRKRTRRTVFLLSIVASIAFLVYATVKLFDCRVDLEDTADTFKARVAFTLEWLNKVAAPASVRAALALATTEFAVVGLLPVVLYPVFARLKSARIRSSGVAGAAGHAVTWAWHGVFLAAAGFIFVVSVVPFVFSLDKPTGQALRPEVLDAYRVSAPLNIANSYGLFRSMTGVGGRPEVVIEGAGSDGVWREYDFRYKPGNVSASPLFVMPHQPRLDWQMWFAALGSYGNNPWFISLVHRLLTNEPTVTALLARNPFPDTPPKQIRATHYTYHYTRQVPGKAPPPAWWWRESPREYLPPLSLDVENFRAYIQKNGWESTELSHETLVGGALTTVRSVLHSASTTLPYYLDDNLAVACALSTLVILITRKMVLGHW